MMLSLSTISEQAMEILYAARVELLMFWLAFFLHRAFFSSKIVKGRSQDKHAKSQLQGFDWGNKGKSRCPSSVLDEAGDVVASANSGEALCNLEAAHERGDYRAVLRCWSCLRKSEGVSAVCLAQVIEAMQRSKKDSACIVSEVRGYLKRNPAACKISFVNHLLESLAKSLDMELANGLVEMLPALNLQSDSNTFEALIQMHFSIRSLAEVMRLASDMQALGLTPTPRTKISLLKTSIQMGRLEDAIQVYREVATQGAGTTASTAPQHVAAQLVELACRQRRVDAVLEELEAGRIPATTETLNSLLGEATRSRDRQLADRIDRIGAAHGVEKNLRTFQLLSSGASGDRSRILALLENMSSAGGASACSPDVVQAILAYCTQNSDNQLADRLYNQLCHLDVLKQGPLLSLVVRFYAEAGKAGRACDIYNAHAHKLELGTERVPLDSRSERCLINAALECGREDTVVMLLKAAPSDTAKHIGMIRGCVTRGNLDGAMTAFRALEKCGVDMTQSIFNTALDACVECQSLRQAEALMKRMESEGVADAVSYNTVIKAYLQQENYERARSIMDTMRKAGFAPNLVTYNELIQGLLRSQKEWRRAQIWEVVEEMKCDGLHPNRITCSILLKNLKARSSNTDVVRTMQLLSSVDEPMDEVLLSSVVEAAVRVGDVQLVSQKLDEFHLKNDVRITGAHTFGSLIKAYGYSKDVAGAWRCWKDMRSQHVKPTSVTIGCMVEAVVSNGDVDGGYELILDLMDDETCKDQVNSIVYGSVLKGYGRTQRLERVLAVFEEMLSKGIEPSQTTYNAVIDACARSGQMNRVPDLVADMKRRRLEPNLITYGTIIKGYCQKNDVPAALAIMHDLRAQRNLKADEIVYNTLLDGCANAGLAADGERLFKEMEAEGVTPSTYTFTCMVKLMGHARRVDRAFELVESVMQKNHVKPNSHVFGALIQTCISSRDIGRAVSAYEWAVRDRMPLDARVCQALIRVLIAAGTERHVQAASLLRCMLGLSAEASKPIPLSESFVEEVAAALRSAGPSSATLAGSLLADVKARKRCFGDDASSRRPGHGCGSRTDRPWR